MRSFESRAFARVALVAVSLSWVGCASMPVATGPTRNVSVGTGAVEALIHKRGEPAVVFESGAGSPLHVWRRVIADLPAEATIFAYNRSGYGRSRIFGNLADPRRSAEALRRALRESGVEPPYLLVGHSLGGLYVNLFARLYPEEVAGVLLVDSSHPDQFEQMRKRRPMLHSVFTTGYALGPPERRYELENAMRFARTLEAAGPFPDVPLTVLTAGKTEAWANDDDLAWWLGLQRELVSMSPRGKGRVIEESGHFIQRDEPQVVVDAIRELLAQARNGGSLAATAR